ncbi:MAG: hypothetical protein BSR46_15670 [Candidatus Dactylopiibacterium carminicum]|nr:MAG: hypothetical protein BSR46_15670 [Candidatus Dactylopiibacterium carminicum]
MKKVASERRLGGLANDTKWDELILWVRAQTDYRPEHRFKRIDSAHVSNWDSEWHFHLPYPLSSIEWLEISFLRIKHRATLVPHITEDHSALIESVLQTIGLDYVKGRSAFRIFGYAPRNLHDFETASITSP